MARKSGSFSFLRLHPAPSQCFCNGESCAWRERDPAAEATLRTALCSLRNGGAVAPGLSWRRSRIRKTPPLPGAQAVAQAYWNQIMRYIYRPTAVRLELKQNQLVAGIE